MSIQTTSRCSKCLLPSTLPGSDFNTEGQCHWCQINFPNYVPEGEDKLIEVLEQHRNPGGSLDCLAGISGGKDSCYALLQLKNKYGMRVEAFTYVHEGMAEFAIENAKKLCRELEVKHHVVGLEDQAHLESFKAFFAAWLEAEEAVTAAMACVACKHMFLLGVRLAQKIGAPTMVWASCPLEVPPFIPTVNKSRQDSKYKGMGDLALDLAHRVCTNHHFRQAFWGNFSTCVFGCLAMKYRSGYMRVRYPSVKHLRFFQYYPWNEQEIIETLKQHTGWSIPDSVVCDWHSDCIFDIFKEYMYQKMLGVSYIDAYLSNKIRYGLLTREAGWKELVRIKGHYADELFKALEVLDLDHLRSKLDPSCFNITEG
ncbi:7-cyano-7-deazaguanine synthase [Planctomycetota bacterium]